MNTKQYTTSPFRIGTHRKIEIQISPSFPGLHVTLYEQDDKSYYYYYFNYFYHSSSMLPHHFLIMMRLPMEAEGNRLLPVAAPSIEDAIFLFGGEQSYYSSQINLS